MHYLFHVFHNDRHLDYLLHYLLNVVVNTDYLWHHALNLYDLRHLHQFLP